MSDLRLIVVDPGHFHAALVQKEMYPALSRLVRIDVPDALRITHDPAFAAFTRGFLALVDDPASLPARHKANLLAKYRVTTEAVALSHG